MITPHGISPRSGTILKLKEVNLPGSLQKPSIRGI